MTTLNVKYFGQWDPTASHFRNDCGPASVAMVLSFLTGKDYPIDVLSAQTSLARQDIGTTGTELVDLLRHYGVQAQQRQWKGLADIRAEIDAGRPVIALVLYGTLKARLDQQDATGGHWLVVVGYDDANMILNDPDWWASKREDGHDFTVPNAQLEAGINQSPAPGWCVFVVSVSQPGTPVVIKTSDFIDLTHWYATPIDFKSAAPEIAGVIHKATEGDQSADPVYASRREQAKAAGLLWGAYHTLIGGINIEAQAKYFLATVQPDAQTLLALDFEGNQTGPTATQAEAEQFATLVQAQTGKWPVLYTAYSYIMRGQPTVLSNCALWLASYAGAQPIVPAQWTGYSAVRYTNGVYGGGPRSTTGVGPCDRSHYVSSLADLNARWGDNLAGTTIPAQKLKGITTTNVWLREGPGTTFGQIKLLALGTQVVLTGQNQHGFVQVSDPAGWISAAYVKHE